MPHSGGHCGGDVVVYRTDLRVKESVDERALSLFELADHNDILRRARRVGHAPFGGAQRDRPVRRPSPHGRRWQAPQLLQRCAGRMMRTSSTLIEGGGCVLEMTSCRRRWWRSLAGPATRTDPGSIVPGIHLRQWCQSSIMSSSEMSVVGSELYVSSLSEPYVSSLSELYVSSLSELYGPPHCLSCTSPHCLSRTSPH